MNQMLGQYSWQKHKIEGIEFAMTLAYSVISLCIKHGGSK